LSVEAEYIASANATKEAIWLCILLKELNFPQTNTIIVYIDNQGCIALTGNPVSHSHAKHINIHHYFICDCVEHSDIKLHYVPTKDMLTDIFTKALSCESFVIFHKFLGIYSGTLLSGSVEN